MASSFPHFLLLLAMVAKKNLTSFPFVLTSPNPELDTPPPPFPPPPPPTPNKKEEEEEEEEKEEEGEEEEVQSILLQLVPARAVSIFTSSECYLWLTVLVDISILPIKQKQTISEVKKKAESPRNKTTNNISVFSVFLPPHHGTKLPKHGWCCQTSGLFKSDLAYRLSNLLSDV